MKVKELIQQLQELNTDADIRVSLVENIRPLGTRQINSPEPVFDQETNQLSFYSIEVDTKLTYPEQEEKLIIPERENTNYKTK